MISPNLSFGPMIVLGIRSEAVKLTPIILEFQPRSSEDAPIVCSTPQHRGMLAQVLDHFLIIPQSRQ